MYEVRRRLCIYSIPFTSLMYIRQLLHMYPGIVLDSSTLRAGLLSLLKTYVCVLVYIPCRNRHIDRFLYQD